jgi:hypothetical protein
VRGGSLISKEKKEWTLKQNTRHNRYWLCIEDPFETTHNLGRVADRNTCVNVGLWCGGAWCGAGGYAQARGSGSGSLHDVTHHFPYGVSSRRLYDIRGEFMRAYRVFNNGGTVGMCGPIS